MSLWQMGECHVMHVVLPRGEYTPIQPVGAAAGVRKAGQVTKVTHGEYAAAAGCQTTQCVCHQSTKLHQNTRRTDQLPHVISTNSSMGSSTAGKYLS